MPSLKQLTPKNLLVQKDLENTDIGKKYHGHTSADHLGACELFVQSKMPEYQSSELLLIAHHTEKQVAVQYFHSASSGSKYCSASFGVGNRN